MTQYYTGFYYNHTDIPNYIQITTPQYDNPDFILGIYDRYGNININYECYIDTTNSTLIDNIIKHIKIPFDFTSNSLIFKNSNFIDFLGYLYNNSTEKLYDKNKMKNFYNIIQQTSNIIPTIQYKLTDQHALPPSKTRMSDAGFDISIIKLHKNINSTTNMYSTGIKLFIPNGYYIRLVPRSSLPKYGYMLSNSEGIIDQGYTGEIFVQLSQLCDNPKPIEYPFKCCQLILEKQYHSHLIEYHSTFDNTSRNSDGFGSTDYS
jgi:dUTP pyrophosphatase